MVTLYLIEVISQFSHHICTTQYIISILLVYYQYIISILLVYYQYIISILSVYVILKSHYE